MSRRCSPVHPYPLLGSTMGRRSNGNFKLSAFDIIIPPSPLYPRLFRGSSPGGGTGIFLCLSCIALVLFEEPWWAAEPTRRIETLHPAQHFTPATSCIHIKNLQAPYNTRVTYVNASKVTQLYHICIPVHIKHNSNIPR